MFLVRPYERTHDAAFNGRSGSSTSGNKETTNKHRKHQTEKCRKRMHKSRRREKTIPLPKITIINSMCHRLCFCLFSHCCCCLPTRLIFFESRRKSITWENVYKQATYIRFYALLSFHRNSELFWILLFFSPRHAFVPLLFSVFVATVVGERRSQCKKKKKNERKKKSVFLYSVACTIKLL